MQRMPFANLRCADPSLPSHSPLVTSHLPLLPETVTRVESLANHRKQTTARPSTRNSAPRHCAANFFACSSQSPSHQWRRFPPADAIIKLPFGGVRRSRGNRA